MAQPFELGQLANSITVDDTNQSIGIGTSVSIAKNLSVSGDTELQQVNAGVITATSIKTNGNLNVIGIITAANVYSDIVGTLNGNVVGDVEGNVTGDVTGNLNGTVTTITAGSTVTIGVGLTALIVDGSVQVSDSVTAQSFNGTVNSDGGNSSLTTLNVTGITTLTTISAGDLTTNQFVSGISTIGVTSATSIDVSGTVTSSELITSSGVQLDGLLLENVNIVQNNIDNASDINLSDGMVHYFTTNGTSQASPNFRFNASTTLNSKMSPGQALTVTLMIPTDAGSFFVNCAIDSVTQTVSWVSTPTSGNPTGAYDVYTFNIIKVDATPNYAVFANSTLFTT